MKHLLSVALATVSLAVGCSTGEQATTEESAGAHNKANTTESPDQSSSATTPSSADPMDEVGPPWPDNGKKLVNQLREEPVSGNDRENRLENELQRLIDNAPDGGTVTIPDGIYAHGFSVYDRKNLTIKGDPGDVWIVENRSNVSVVRIEQSHGITIEGLGLLHDPEDRCSADALDIHSSYDITARDNDFSGSGVSGISAVWSANLRFLNNHIHDATVYMVKLHEVANVEVAGNLIRKNPRKYEQIWRQGIHVDQPHGDIVIRRNLVVDNRSTPVTVEFPEERRDDPETPPPGTVHISNNVFARNTHPNLPAVAYRTQSDEKRPYDKALGDIVVRNNCFDPGEGRDRIQSQVPDATTIDGNELAPVEITGSFKVTSPELCAMDFSTPARWIERFKNRPSNPPHSHDTHPHGAECPYEE